jgi:hypothetical protein
MTVFLKYVIICKFTVKESPIKEVRSDLVQLIQHFSWKEPIHTFDSENGWMAPCAQVPLKYKSYLSILLSQRSEMLA